MRPGHLGDIVTIWAINKKIGKNIGLANIEIYDSKDWLLVTGSHEAFYGNPILIDGKKLLDVI